MAADTKAGIAGERVAGEVEVSRFGGIVAAGVAAQSAKAEIATKV